MTSQIIENKLASFLHELTYQLMQLAYQLMQVVHTELKTALVTKLHSFYCFGFGQPPASAVPILQDEKNQMCITSTLSADTVSLLCVL